ncbi:hypothetical protein ACN9MF_07230 [Methylobacterium fujisawaense]|uniref:hypothetical protein n=1 Tax=Methylobacterium fujisawaense TaxID=107400 RepID=UPI003CE6CE00
MKTLISLTVAGLLTTGAAATAAENTGPRMQGSPNAAGYTGKDETGKGATTGTTTGTTTGSPGSEMPKQDGRMKGPPNAAGFQPGGDKAGGAAGAPDRR